ncbi:MAG TPA: PQQ-dependent sugar dehydrogenase, partial [Verrucomicrobiota bacterium]|nr:PQQ-dependent sugar dehydrogenase [Verrucomicrobiota bacterium]
MNPPAALSRPAWCRLLLAVGLGLTAACASALERVVNTTLTLPQNPATLGYRVADALGGLRFDRPVALATPPGETNRLFVVEQSGRIIVITNLAAPTRTVFTTLTQDLLSSGEQGLLGLAFHPDYARNGRFFTFRTISTGLGAARTLHDVLAEFRVDPEDPSRADPATEIQLFRVRDEASNHNGGDLHFGPDGYLYVAVGDEGGANDQFNNSQRITGELFAGLLRLDVDRRPGSLPPNRLPGSALEAFWYTTNYAVPADNPYVGATNFLGRAVDPARVRTEFWSVGLRNPWRMACDVTGELWGGDAGRGARAGVFLAGRGSNPGWAYREGSIPGPRAGGAPPGFLTNPAFNHVPPLHEYTHGNGPMQGRSITGGRVYRGERLPALYGAYVFADYVSGNVWALRRFDGRVQVERLLAVSAVSAFGAGPRNGDLPPAPHQSRQILRPVPQPAPGGPPLPPPLADTGAFADLALLTPHAGLVPYAPNVPFWSDGADKRRWFAITHGSQFVTFRPDAKWSFPTGMIWVKHFELELTHGVPESVRRLETRFLVRNAGGVYGVTYRWTDPPTNAVLVPEQGLDETFLVQDANGLIRTQAWRYPGRAECLQCHTPVGGGVLGMDTAQFNGLFDHGQGTTNQLAALAAGGWFSNPPANLAALPALAPAEEGRWSVERR